MIGTWLVFGGIGEMREGLSWPRFVGCIGCAKRILIFQLGWQDSHLFHLPISGFTSWNHPMFFGAGKRTLAGFSKAADWDVSWLLLWESIFSVFGHVKLIIFLCLGREEFVWEDERDEILKDSWVLMEFFPFSRTQYFRTEFFFGTDMMNHCSILRSEFRRGNRVPTSFNLCRLLLMLGFQSPAAPWKSIVRTELLLDVVLGLGTWPYCWYLKSGEHQLSLVVYPITSKVLAPSQVVRRIFSINRMMKVWVSFKGHGATVTILNIILYLINLPPPPRSKGQGSIRAY